MKSDGQLMLSIGALLAAERENRGIPVERAAKETRMRPQRIRDMENDDLSHFTNPSYARMFIIAYAKYLGIPMRTINEHLPDPGESATEGYQYISTSTEHLPSLRHDIASKPARRGNALYLLAIATLVTVLLTAGATIYFLSVSAERLTQSVDKPAPTPEPTPEPVQAVATQTTRVEIFATDNFRADGSPASAFEQKVEWVPPQPDGDQISVARSYVPGLSATIASDPGAGPTPQSVITEDQVFLMSPSTEARPQNVRQ